MTAWTNEMTRRRTALVVFIGGVLASVTTNAQLLTCPDVTCTAGMCTQSGNLDCGGGFIGVKAFANATCNATNGNATKGPGTTAPFCSFSWEAGQNETAMFFDNEGFASECTSLDINVTIMLPRCAGGDNSTWITTSCYEAIYSCRVEGINGLPVELMRLDIND